MATSRFAQITEKECPTEISPVFGLVLRFFRLK